MSAYEIAERKHAFTIAESSGVEAIEDLFESCVEETYMDADLLSDVLAIVRERADICFSKSQFILSEAYNGLVFRLEEVIA